MLGRGLNILQLGAGGQQGSRNIQKMEQLYKRYSIEDVYAIDIDRNRLSKTKKKHPWIKAYVMKSRDALWEFAPYSDIIFDSTWTPHHLENLETLVDVAEIRGTPVKAYYVEKPVGIESSEVKRYVERLNRNGIRVSENAIELMPYVDPNRFNVNHYNSKIALINDIKKNGYRIKEIDFIRNSDAHLKSSPGRNILRDYAGSTRDKLDHDADDLFLGFKVVNGRIPNVDIANVDFKLLEIIDSMGDKFYWTRKGQKAYYPGIEEVNESYGKIELQVGDTKVKMIGSHYPGITRKDEKMVEKWFTKEMKERLMLETKRPSWEMKLVKSDDKGSKEVRAKRVVCEDEDGKEVIYLSNTFDRIKFGDPGALYFTIKQFEDGSVYLVQQGQYDNHLGYVRDALQVALGIREEPWIPEDVIIKTSETLGKTTKLGWESAVDREKFNILDIRKHPELIFLEE
ncbi:MAG: hypothetical protein J7K87_00235 [Candidatus Aenigmarchaeota archaeon]|nr:hypothetical protein [Candidatus Aenigmarchaeota archaeon]